MRARLRAPLAFLALVGAAALAAPWLGLRDPAAQPDGLVLRDLPPLSRARAVRLSSGELRYVHEARETVDGAVEVRRGERRARLARSELAADWRADTWFPLGTDGYGRDLLSRLVHGARISLLVAVLAAAAALFIGATAGLAAGLAGGVVDGLLMRATDVMLAIPRLFLALFLVAVYGPSLVTTVGVLAATGWMAAARLVRGQVLSLRERPFVGAARAGGASPLRLALLHVLPGALPPVLVEATLRVGDAILLEGALSFLGLGVPPPMPSWGNMIAEGRDRLLDAWWISTLPGLAIVATVVALSLVGDALGEPRAAVRAAPPEAVPPARPAAPGPAARQEPGPVACMVD